MRHSVKKVTGTKRKAQLAAQCFEATIVVAGVEDRRGFQYIYVAIVAEWQARLIVKLVSVENHIIYLAASDIGTVAVTGPANADVGFDTWHRRNRTSEIVLPSSRGRRQIEKRNF